MIVTVHQPEHLPYLGFCHKASAAQMLVLLDVVQYRKNYFQNRNRILGPNGAMWLTVPVRMQGHMNKVIAEMTVDHSQNWAPRWWKSLYFSYKHTPYFDEHAAFFSSIAEARVERLADLNEHIIRYLFDAIGITCRIIRASELPVSGARSALLAQICGAVGASAYLAGQSGKDYLDESLFAAQNIAVQHHVFHHPVYDQGRPDFVPYLSVVDLLFRHGPGTLGVIQSGSATRG